MLDQEKDTLMQHAPKQHKKESAGLKLALELGPLMVFFFVNMRAEWLIKTFPILAHIGTPLLVATAFFMVATLIALIISRILVGHLPIMPIISGIVVLIFGGLSLYLQDELFIKMKPTIINLIFGGILLIGLLFDKAFLGIVFNAAFELDEAGWKKLTFRWGIFFLFLAALNEVIWRNFSNDFWISFKVWGTMPITLLFAAAQMPLLMRHALDKPPQNDVSDLNDAKQDIK